MRVSLDITAIAAKVLKAATENQPPDPADVEALRQYIQTTNGRDLDELACDAIQKALQHRAQMRRATS